MGRGTLVALGLFAMACTPPPFVSPAQGGPAWTKLTTDHFTIYTDMPQSDAEAVVGDLQDSYAALQDLAFPNWKRATGRFEVTLFQHEPAFRQIAPHEDVRGYFTLQSHDPDGRPMIVLYHGLDATVRNVVQHEFVHRFIAYYCPSAPRWLNEGLAMYYESLTLVEGKARIGLPPNHWSPYGEGSVFFGTDRGVTTISRAEMPTVVSITANLDARHFDPGGSAIESTKERVLHYAASWNLIHAMYMGPAPFPEALDDYLVALGEGAETHEAWDKALASHGISPELIEKQYESHVDNYRVQYGTKSYVPRPRAALHAQPMTEAEVRVLWARVRPWRGDGEALAGKDLEAAIRADPNSATAYAMRGVWLGWQGHYAEALPDLRKAVALAPDDYRMTFLLAVYLESQAMAKKDSSTALRSELLQLIDRLRENAGAAPAWMLVAAYDASRGDPEHALTFAHKAIVADPSCFLCYDIAAVALHDLGKLNEAVSAERIGVQLMPDGSQDPDLVNRLRKYEREATNFSATPH